MEVTELPPTPFVLPTAGDLVHVRTQQWTLERWEGDDLPGLATPLGPQAQVLGEREPVVRGAGRGGSPAR